jgi:hypothetical protein
MNALDRRNGREFDLDRLGNGEGPAKAVLIYVNTNAEVGDVNHLKASPTRMSPTPGFGRAIRKALRSCIR